MNSRHVRVPRVDVADALALGGRSLAVAAGEQIVVVDLAGGQSRVLEAPFLVAELEVSPSGRYVAAMPSRRDRPQAAVFDLEGGTTEVITRPGGRDLITLTFTRDTSDEWLLLAPNTRELHLLDPSGRKPYGIAETGSLIVDQLTQISPAQAIAIGHGEGEGTDSLYVFRLPVPSAGLGGIQEDFVRYADTTYRLNAGPAPEGAYVAFRDHEDVEDDPDEVPNDPLYGLVGLYLRHPGDDDAFERIPWNGPIRRHDRLFATEEWVALEMGPTAQLVSRHGADPVVLDGAATAVDTFDLRLAVVTPDGEATVIDLRSP